MLVRFTLDPELDRELIEKIKSRAGRGNLNKAAYLLFVEWSKAENVLNLSLTRHDNDRSATNSVNSPEANDFDLSSFEAAFDDM